MKKFIVLFVIMVVALASFSQSSSAYKMYKTQNYHNQLRLNTMTGEVLQIQDDGASWVVCSAIESFGDKEGRFRLYETKNMWTFILLDTYSGRCWQLQYSVQDVESICSIPIRIISFAYPEKYSRWTGRFKMIKTENMWTFILLDTYTGRLWQIQYSVEDIKDILCVAINEEDLVSNNEKSIFSIQPLVSMYQYYLINNTNGDMWKFQWSTKNEDGYRWIQKFK